MPKHIFVVASVLICMLARPSPAADSSREQMKGLDDQVQEVKTDVLSIAADLNQLEEKLLYPSNTHLAVFVRLATGETLRLDTVQIQIDGQLATHYLYSFKELEALRKGGVQRIPLRLIDPAVLRHLRIEPFERVEVLTLVCVVQGLAEIEVTQLVRNGWLAGERRQRQSKQQLMRSPVHGLPIPELDPGMAGIRAREHHTDQFRLDLLREGEVLALVVVLPVRELSLSGRHVRSLHNVTCWKPL